MSTNPYDSEAYVRANRFDPTHLAKVTRLLDPKAGAKVLEVGCGRGYLTKAMIEELDLDVIGTDVNPNAEGEAVSDRVRAMSAEDLDFPDDHFDHIVTVHAIEHIPPIEMAFAEMTRVLKPGGTLLAIYPAEPIQGLFAIPTSIILHGTPFKAREVHCHKLTPSKVRAIATPFGLTETHHEFNLLRSPQFVSVFQK
ncbi:MAG: methyltransferase domain-containing protein [Acidimicrobiia bacterium]|nr:methyltransferase domain-containing protein [Acidimicrobiia bacterium]